MNTTVATATATARRPPTRTQRRRADIDRKIAALGCDDQDRPLVKPVKAGSATVPIITVRNGKHWAFQVPFYPAGPGGRRQLKTFADPDAAGLFASTVATGKTECLDALKGLTVAQIGELAVLAELLVPFCAERNFSLTQALKEYLAAKRLAGERSLATVVQDYLHQPWVTKSRLPLPQVITEFLASKRLRNCKPRTLNKLHYVLHAFSRRCGGPPLADVTSRQIQAEIFAPTRKPRSNYTYYCELHGFFAWCRRNGYLRPDCPTAMDAVEAPLFDRQDPDVITPALAVRLLRAVSDPECVLYLVLCLFSGGRAAELRSARGENLAPGEFLRIAAADAKKRADKTIAISPGLDRWLRPWYGRAGFLIGVQHVQAKIVQRLRAYNAELAAAPASEPPLVWKRNWLRHSFSAYRLHATGDLIGTAEECDHDPATMARYYLVKVPVEAAARYFEISPEACGKPDWDQVVQAHLAATPELHQRAGGKSRTPAGGTLAPAPRNGGQTENRHGNQSHNAGGPRGTLGDQTTTGGAPAMLPAHGEQPDAPADPALPQNRPAAPLRSRRVRSGPRGLSGQVAGGAPVLATPPNRRQPQGGPSFRPNQETC